VTSADALAAALTAAVEAAQAQDLLAYDAALARLALSDVPRVSSVTGAVVRDVLEQRHPGGLTGEDVGGVLRRAAGTAAWLPDLDPEVLLVVVTGALGLLDVDDQPATLSPKAILRHAPVLLASLLNGPPSGPQPALPLGPRLTAALAELRRAETVELP